MDLQFVKTGHRNVSWELDMSNSNLYTSQVPNNIQRDNEILNHTTDKDKSAKPNHPEIAGTLKQRSLWLPEFVQRESQMRLCAITISIHLEVDQSILSTTCFHQEPAIWGHPGDSKKGRKKKTKTAEASDRGEMCYLVWRAAVWGRLEHSASM